MEMESYLRFGLALVIVLGLIVVVAWLARRYGPSARMASRSGRKRRLGIVEISAVDGKRRLVLVRRDDVEHLLLLGAGSETVVESGIPVSDDDAAGERKQVAPFGSEVAKSMAAGSPDKVEA